MTPAPIDRALALAALLAPLPTRRPCETQHVHIGEPGRQHSVHVTVGRYPAGHRLAGQIGEVAIEIHREGAPLRGAYGALAETLSAALQRGVPLEVLVEPLLGVRCEPSGPVVGHETITTCTSVPDLLGLLLLKMGGGS